jgi:hypothetical protein
MIEVELMFSPTQVIFYCRDFPPSFEGVVLSFDENLREKNFSDFCQILILWLSTGFCTVTGAQEKSGGWQAPRWRQHFGWQKSTLRSRWQMHTQREVRHKRSDTTGRRRRRHSRKKRGGAKEHSRQKQERGWRAQPSRQKQEQGWRAQPTDTQRASGGVRAIESEKWILR